MSRPRAMPVPVRRQVILCAARAALIEKGYEAVLLSDVARRAGVAKGTLYLYFKDKEDLVAAVLEDVIDRMETRLEQQPKTGGAVERLTRLAADKLDFWEENQDFLSQFSRERPNLCGKAAGRVLRERFRAHLDLLAEEVRAGVREGALKAVDPELGALYLLALVRMFYLRKLVLGSRKPLKSCAPELMGLFLGGLGRRPA